MDHNPQDLLLPASPRSDQLDVRRLLWNDVLMLDLDGALVRALRDALAAEGIEPGDPVRVERPADTAHGDRATNIAMQAAKAAGRAPRDLAESLRARLAVSPPPYVASIEVAGPGFLNFRLDDGWLYEVLRAAVTEGEADFARPTFGEGERVQVEFVSANPTGPVHVGNGWWASYGDAVARLLERCAYLVEREYYINDTGGQVRRLGASVLSRRAGQPVPEDGYPSGFVKGLAAAYDGPDDVVVAGRWAAERTLGFIKMQMAKINITFDSWYSQAAIEDSERSPVPSPSSRSEGSSSKRTGRCGCAPVSSAIPGTSACCASPTGITPIWPVTLPITATSSWSEGSTASSTSGAPTTRLVPLLENAGALRTRAAMASRLMPRFETGWPGCGEAGGGGRGRRRPVLRSFLRPGRPRSGRGAGGRTARTAGRSTTAHARCGSR